MAQTKSNIFLFYGEDGYSSLQKLKFWKQEFAKKYGEDSIEEIEGKTLNPADFTTNIQAVPFLSEKRLTIIKDFLSQSYPEEQKQVAEGLDKTIEECIIVFYENEMPDKRTSLFKKISQIGQLEEFFLLSPQELLKWILSEAKIKDIKINTEEAMYLSQHVGQDLWTVSNELEKLKLFANNALVSKEMIDAICIPSLTSSIFKLTDSIAQKDLKQSLKTFEILRESGEDLIRIFFMIARHFRILIQVHEMLEKKESSFSITKKLKQHPFVIQKTSSQSKNFNREKLEKIHKKLLEIDTKTKTGIIKSFKTDNREFELAVEQLIIDCCK